MLEPGPPDRQGHHLRVIANVLKWYGNQQADGVTAAALFWDFPPLPQEPRTPEENNVFRRGLGSLNVIYGHNLTSIIQQMWLPAGFSGPSYEQSGLCTFESTVGTIFKSFGHRLCITDESCLYNNRYYFLRGKALTKPRPAPMKPADFDDVIMNKHFMSKKKDPEHVKRLYRTTWHEATAGCTALSFPCAGWEADQMRQLAEIMPSFGHCVRLELPRNRFGKDGAQHLRAMTRLTTLNIWDNGIGEAGARHLSALTQLTTLDIGMNNLGDAGARHVSALTQLTTLDIEDNGIGEAGARHLSALTQLTALYIEDNNLGDAGARHLSALTQLTKLNIANNNLGDAGARHLSALTQLHWACISCNYIGEDGLRHLNAMPQLASLINEGQYLSKLHCSLTRGS